QITHNFEYFRKYENPMNVSTPTRNIPLIYNLFGSVEDDESMIFSHDDMFEFLFAVLGNYQLPKEIKNQLKSAKNFILLGFTFEKWYMKLILRLFNLHTGRFLRYASKSKEIITPETRELYENHFRINFIDKELTDFIDKIYTLCDVENLLRELGTGEELDFINAVRNHIENGDIEQAVDRLSSYLEREGEEELLNDLVLISGSYKRLKRRMNKGTISEESSELKMNQIYSSLLDLTEEIRELQAEDF
ncbi:MAG: SIR2 family protein, partial [Flammeovirgaceae bacterium]